MLLLLEVSSVTILFLYCVSTDTTDVQRAILKVDHIQQAFEVTCEFLAHSSARGCLVTVNGTFGTYSRSVSREGGSARHQYHVGRPLGSLTYSVQDWEEDGSIGSALLPIELKNASLELPPMVVTAGITGERMVIVALSPK